MCENIDKAGASTGKAIMRKMSLIWFDNRTEKSDPLPGRDKVNLAGMETEAEGPNKKVRIRGTAERSSSREPPTM